ncbi:MAG TPA: site-specific integrase [Patescibacteria group bacterium]|nr:site-specific integrase [Patescibacteria group bacterium]
MRSGNEDRVKRNCTGYAQVNWNLVEIETKVQDLYQYAKRTLKIEPFQYIKEELLKSGVLERPIVTVEVTYVSVLDRFNEFIEKRKSTDAKASIKIYTTTYIHLCKFIGTKYKLFNFEDINSAFQDKYISYLLKDAQLTNTTVGKHLMIFKPFLHWATDRGYNTKTDYQKLFKRTEFETDATTFALTWEELNCIEKLELSENQRLDRVRDLFLISYYTGMRFSDVSTLQPHNIQGSVIRFTIIKTKESISIPIIPPFTNTFK